MKPKIEIPVAGIVMGFPYDDESEKAAIARLVLEAEMHGNDGKARIHLSISNPTVQETSDLCLICGEGPQDTHQETDHAFIPGSLKPSAETFRIALHALVEDYINSADDAEGEKYWTGKFKHCDTLRTNSLKDHVIDFATYVETLLVQTL